MTALALAGCVASPEAPSMAVPPVSATSALDVGCEETTMLSGGLFYEFDVADVDGSVHVLLRWPPAVISRSRGGDWRMGPRLPENVHPYEGAVLAHRGDLYVSLVGGRLHASRAVAGRLGLPVAVAQTSNRYSFASSQANS